MARFFDLLLKRLLKLRLPALFRFDLNPDDSLKPLIRAAIFRRIERQNIRHTLYAELEESALRFHRARVHSEGKDSLRRQPVQNRLLNRALWCHASFLSVFLPSNSFTMRSPCSLKS
jgi:hypothetical protein